MEKTAVVTGAGSGVGRAVTLALCQKGWRVALIGRRESALKETLRLTGKSANNGLIFPCDVSQAALVFETAKAILGKLDTVDVLVNAAGTNVRDRSLELLKFEDYQQMIATNMTGAYLCVQAFLPAMREQKSGTIVNIVSEAGKWANAKAGPAYVMSKFGLAGLTQSINAEERGRGIRACSVFPGDINTPILDLRPYPPSTDARQQMPQPEDIAECVMLAVNLPNRVVVEEILVRPK